MSRLELFLVILILGALGWIGFGFYKGNHQDMCSPLPLSQEVKAYIDKKITANGGGQCAEIPTLVAKIADLQLKLGAIELYRVNKSQVDGKHAEFLETSAQMRDKWKQQIDAMRTDEVNKIKADLGSLCSTPGMHTQRGSDRGGRRQNPAPVPESQTK